MLKTLKTFSKEARRYPRILFQFTVSDFKTIWGPTTVLGLVSAISLAPEDVESTQILVRAPLVIFWVYINLLAIDILNQRSTESVAEDAVNKPWRPLPSGLLSQREATNLMLATYVLAVGLSKFVLGGFLPCLSLIFFGCWYNVFGGANRSCIERNALNAIGYISFGIGATEVALGTAQSLDARSREWFVLLGIVIFSTVCLNLDITYSQLIIMVDARTGLTRRNRGSSSIPHYHSTSHR